MVKRNGTVAANMYVPTLSALEERWVGARTHVADLQTKVGIPGRNLDELKGAIDSLASGDLPFYVVPDVQTSDYATEDSLTRGSASWRSSGRPTRGW